MLSFKPYPDRMVFNYFSSAHILSILDTQYDASSISFKRIRVISTLRYIKYPTLGAHPACLRGNVYFDTSEMNSWVTRSLFPI